MPGYSTEGVLVAWDEERDMALLDRYKVWILDRKETLRCATPFGLMDASVQLRQRRTAIRSRVLLRS